MYCILSRLQVQYLEVTKTNDASSICTFLDPKFKYKFFDEERLKIVKQLVSSECNTVCVNTENEDLAPRCKKPRRKLAAILGNLTESAEPKNNSVDNEIENYIYSPTINIEHNPLNW